MTLGKEQGGRGFIPSFPTCHVTAHTVSSVQVLWVPSLVISEPSGKVSLVL